MGSFDSTHEIAEHSTCRCKRGFSGITCHVFDYFYAYLENLTGRRDFIVTCNGPCMGINATITGDGDADLFAATVFPPIDSAS